MSIVSEAKLRLGIGKLARDFNKVSFLTDYDKQKLDTAQSDLRNAKRANNKEDIKEAKVKVSFFKNKLQEDKNIFKKII